MSADTPPDTESIRLVGGAAPNEGLVQVSYKSTWGLVAGISNYYGSGNQYAWDDLDAAVACRQLGYATGIARHGDGWASPYNRTYDMPVWLSNVHCGGYESSLQACTATWSQQSWNAYVYNLAGVICSSGTLETFERHSVMGKVRYLYENHITCITAFYGDAACLEETNLLLIVCALSCKQSIYRMALCGCLEQSLPSWVVWRWRSTAYGVLWTIAGGAGRSRSWPALL